MRATFPANANFTVLDDKKINMIDILKKYRTARPGLQNRYFIIITVFQVLNSLRHCLFIIDQGEVFYVDIDRHLC